ncbi:hypothetical protein [Streptomyces sp. NPDC001401]|uniref:hypothetical protein n=1 Tax=Streptomyces sp. NPDC001401 TaxID=3364570 RepID=UPI00369A03C2
MEIRERFAAAWKHTPAEDTGALLADRDGELRVMAVSAEWIRAVQALPMRLRDEVVGALNVFRQFSAVRISLLRAAARRRKGG